MTWPPKTGPLSPRPLGHALTVADARRWLARGDGDLGDLCRGAQVSPEAAGRWLAGEITLSDGQRRALSCTAESLSLPPRADRIEQMKTARERERAEWEQGWLARENPPPGARRRLPLSRMPV